MFVQLSGDEFDAKYELLKCVTEVGVRTYQAQRDDGQILMVHFLGLGSIEENQGRLSQISALRPEARGRVVEMIDIDSSIIVVTEFLTQFDNFDGWLGRESGTPGSAQAKQPTASSSAETVAIPVPEEPAPATGEPGEFTQLFGPDSASKLDEAVAREHPKEEPQPESRPPQVPAGPGQPAPGQPGEFTQVFGRDSDGEPASEIPAGLGETDSEPSEQEPPKAVQLPSDQPGEFTRMFGSDATAALNEASSGASDPGDESSSPTVHEADAVEDLLPEPPTAPSEASTGEDTQPFRPSVETAGVVEGAEPPAIEPAPDQKSPPGPRKPIIRWRGDKSAEPDSGEQPKVRWQGPGEAQPQVPAPPPQAPVAPPHAPATPPPPASVTPVAGAEPPQPKPPQGPGEFTQLFGDESPPARPNDAPRHDTDPRRSLESMDQDDLGLGEPPPAGADSLRPAQPPGQFTQMFRSGSGLDEPQQEVPQPPQPATPAPPADDTKKPGSFTEIFGTTGEPSDYPLPPVKPQPTPPPAQPQVTPSPPVSQPPPPGATPPAAPPMPPMAAQPAAVPPPVPPQPQGPGEFTRMVSDTPAAPQQMAPPPPPPSPGVAPVGAYGTETPKKSQLPLLIIGLSVVVLLAVVLILVVVLT